MRPLAALLTETVRIERDGWPDKPTPGYRDAARRLSKVEPTSTEIAYVIGALAATLVRLPDGNRTLLRLVSEWPEATS